MWFDAASDDYIEGENLYQSIAEAGVDMICTDFPEAAEKAISKARRSIYLADIWKNSDFL